MTNEDYQIIGRPKISMDFAINRFIDIHTEKNKRNFALIEEILEQNAPYENTGLTFHLEEERRKVHTFFLNSEKDNMCVFYALSYAQMVGLYQLTRVLKLKNLCYEEWIACYDEYQMNINIEEQLWDLMNGKNQ